jgi:hypothetical protein
MNSWQDFHEEVLFPILQMSEQQCLCISHWVRNLGYSSTFTSFLILAFLLSGLDVLVVSLLMHRIFWDPSKHDVFVHFNPVSENLLWVWRMNVALFSINNAKCSKLQIQPIDNTLVLFKIWGQRCNLRWTHLRLII